VTTPVIVRPAELRRRGVTDKEARRLCRALQRLTYESYADLGGLSPEEVHLVRARAIVQRRPTAVASHVTAAVALGLPVPRSALDRIHLNPADGVRGNVRSRADFWMHPRVVPADEVYRVNGLAVTSPLRTVLECPRVTSLDWSVATADAALHQGLITPEQLQVAGAAVRGVRGAQRSRQAAVLASPLAESPGESLARMRMLRLGWAPAEQVVLAGVGGRPRVDFVVEDCLVVEFDGAGKYELNGDPARAHFAEKERNDRITEAGYEIIHIIWDQLWDEAELGRRLRAALGRARARRLP
jgi:very-short-patch-repair endonuclease